MAFEEEGSVWGRRPKALCVVGCLSLTSLFCLHRVQQLPQALCLATFPPMMGCLEAPSHQVSFRYVLAWGLCWAGSDERAGQESSFVCHGLNTVALCWLRPCSLTSSTSPKAAEAKEARWEGVSFQAGCGRALLATLVLGEASASWPVWSCFL